MLNALIARQRTLGENDGEFSVRLGLPRSTWQAYRTGKLPPTLRLAAAARMAFPDMIPEIRSFLLSDASGLAHLATVLNTETEVPA